MGFFYNNNSLFIAGRYYNNQTITTKIGGLRKNLVNIFSMYCPGKLYFLAFEKKPNTKITDADTVSRLMTFQLFKIS